MIGGLSAYWLLIIPRFIVLDYCECERLLLESSKISPSELSSQLVDHLGRDPGH